MPSAPSLPSADVNSQRRLRLAFASDDDLADHFARRGLPLLAHTFTTDRPAAVAALFEVFQRLRAPVVVDEALLRASLNSR